MARIQYQRAAKAGGYRPQQVDERNIARLREETARQIEVCVKQLTLRLSLAVRLHVQ